MRTLLLTSLFSLVACLTVSSPALAVNLVSNGGFETGDFTSWTLQGTQNSLFNVANFQSHTGTYSMFFAELEVDNDQFHQATPTINGQQYSLEFYLFNLFNDENIGLGSDGLEVFWEGNSVFDLAPINTPVNQWTKFTIPVTATGDGSELRIGGFDAPLAIFVDDISLTPVPEPSTMLLAMIGLGAFALARRRVRR